MKHKKDNMLNLPTVSVYMSSILSPNDAKLLEIIIDILKVDGGEMRLARLLKATEKKYPGKHFIKTKLRKNIREVIYKSSDTLYLHSGYVRLRESDLDTPLEDAARLAYFASECELLMGDSSKNISSILNKICDSNIRTKLFQGASVLSKKSQYMHSDPYVKFPGLKDVPSSRETLLANEKNPSYIACAQTRSSLPCNQMMDEILKAINENQVCVLVSPTGSGKTTQVPQSLVKDLLLKDINVGVVCTQPRRLAAVSVAARVSEEMGCLCTGADLVSHQVRFDVKANKNGTTRLLFCTQGILLRRLLVNPTLDGITHIIVDEAHEREVNSDFALAILRKLLWSSRPDLKVVIMSATINPAIFVDYFTAIPPDVFLLKNECEVETADGNKTVHVSCKVVDVPGQVFPITTTVCAPPPSRRERNSSIDLTPTEPVLGVPSQSAKNLMSFEEVPLQLETAPPVDIQRVAKVILSIHNEEEGFKLPPESQSQLRGGTVLVFLPGWGEILDVEKQLNRAPLTPNNKLLILKVHSGVRAQDQLKIFKPAPPNTRKIVLSTNIAETSITVPDVTFVVDSGCMRCAVFNPTTFTSSLRLCRIAKSNMKQRRGRAGRVAPGMYFPLFDPDQDIKNEFVAPEMERLSADSLILMVKTLGLVPVDCAAYVFLRTCISPPSPQRLLHARRKLSELGLLQIGAVEQNNYARDDEDDGLQSPIGVKDFGPRSFVTVKREIVKSSPLLRCFNNNLVAMQDFIQNTYSGKFFNSTTSDNFDEFNNDNTYDDQDDDDDEEELTSILSASELALKRSMEHVRINATKIAQQRQSGRIRSGDFIDISSSSSFISSSDEETSDTSFPSISDSDELNPDAGDFDGNKFDDNKFDDIPSWSTSSSFSVDDDDDDLEVGIKNLDKIKKEMSDEARKAIRTSRLLTGKERIAMRERQTRSAPFMLNYNSIKDQDEEELDNEISSSSNSSSSAIHEEDEENSLLLGESEGVVDFNESSSSANKSRRENDVKGRKQKTSSNSKTDSCKSDRVIERWQSGVRSRGASPVRSEVDIEVQRLISLPSLLASPETLTPLGHLAGSLPTEPSLAMMILIGGVMGVANSVSRLVSLIDNPLFPVPKDSRAVQSQRKVKNALISDSYPYSDHLMLLNALEVASKHHKLYFSNKTLPFENVKQKLQTAGQLNDTFVSLFKKGKATSKIDLSSSTTAGTNCFPEDIKEEIDLVDDIDYQHESTFHDEIIDNEKETQSSPFVNAPLLKCVKKFLTRLEPPAFNPPPSFPSVSPVSSAPPSSIPQISGLGFPPPPPVVVSAPVSAHHGPTSLPTVESDPNSETNILFALAASLGASSSLLGRQFGAHLRSKGPHFRFGDKRLRTVMHPSSVVQISQAPANFPAVSLSVFQSDLQTNTTREASIVSPISILLTAPLVQRQVKVSVTSPSSMSSKHCYHKKYNKLKHEDLTTTKNENILRIGAGQALPFPTSTSHAADWQKKLHLIRLQWQNILNLFVSVLYGTVHETQIKSLLSLYEKNKKLNNNSAASENNLTTNEYECLKSLLLYSSPNSLPNVLHHLSSAAAEISLLLQQSFDLCSSVADTVSGSSRLLCSFASKTLGIQDPANTLFIRSRSESLKKVREGKNVKKAKTKRFLFNSPPVVEDTVEVKRKINLFYQTLKNDSDLVSNAHFTMNRSEFLFNFKKSKCRISTPSFLNNLPYDDAFRTMMVEARKYAFEKLIESLDENDQDLSLRDFSKKKENKTSGKKVLKSSAKLSRKYLEGSTVNDAIETAEGVFPKPGNQIKQKVKSIPFGLETADFFQIPENKKEMKQSKLMKPKKYNATSKKNKSKK